MPHIDFDLHGLLGIRLIDATVSDAAVVARQLGLCPTPLMRAPDVFIRWVDRLLADTPLQVLGDHEGGFANGSFMVLRGKHKTRLRAQIPFESIGGKLEIVCERGLPAVPLLTPIVNLTLLAKSIAPIHAAAFVHQGRGILAAGWSKGGKTEALLSFLANGARYVADDWTYVTADGCHLYGIPEPVRLRSWHLQSLPSFRKRIPWAARTRMRVLGWADCGKDVITSVSRRLPSGPVRRLLHALSAQAFVTAPVQRLFEGQIASQPATFDHLFLLASHQSSQIRVEPIDPCEVARRMVFSIREERERFLSFYRMFCFAYPGRSNPFIEDADRLQRELLLAALANKPAHLVLHPYPVRIPALFEAMRPVLDATKYRPTRRREQNGHSSTETANVLDQLHCPLPFGAEECSPLP